MKRPHFTLARVVMVLGIWFLLAFVYVLFDANQHTYGSGFNSVGIGVLVIAALVALVGAGNLTYGRNSHYAKAWERIRPSRQRPRRSAVPTTHPSPGEDAPAP